MRLLRIGGIYLKPCGGTHVRRIGDIGSFRIASEGSVASGVRRIEALTGLCAVAAAAADRERLRELGALLKAPPDQVRERVEALQEEVRQARRAQEKAAQEAGAKLGERLAGQSVVLNGVRVLVARAPGVDAKGLRGLWDSVVKAGVEAGLLVGEAGEKAPLLAGAAPSAVAKGVDAADLLRTAGKVLGGGGGGRPDLAQGQGSARAKVGEALGAVEERLKAVLRA